MGSAPSSHEGGNYRAFPVFKNDEEMAEWFETMDIEAWELRPEPNVAAASTVGLVLLPPEGDDDAE